MTFTDDNLERLKEETTRHGGGKCGVDCQYPLIDILGLLARMEAAEQVVSGVAKIHNLCFELDWQKYLPEIVTAYFDWRKKAGK